MPERVPAKGGWDGLANSIRAGTRRTSKWHAGQQASETGTRRGSPNNSVRRARTATGTLLRIGASGAAYDRSMWTAFGSSDGTGTAIFPTMGRTVRQDSFREVKSLRFAVPNEGLEVLGTTTKNIAESRGEWLESVKSPSTLRRVECTTFLNCKKLKFVSLAEGLEYIGKLSFRDQTRKRGVSGIAQNNRSMDI